MLMWNAIVKDESRIIERCVRSLMPHIDGAIIVDTGSKDNTVEILEKLFADAGKPLELQRVSFENFSQARNAALQLARRSQLPWEWLLLADADMELVVQEPLRLNGGLSYDVRQRAGSLDYYNRRFVSCEATGEFCGVTHEYLDVASSGRIDTVFFIDHADGANRPEKFQRDIALLEEALKTEMRPGLVERYHFYLAQSYFDSKNWEMAAEHYKIRVGLGGFDEEQWNAQLHYAHAIGNLGRDAEFVWEILQAYKMRPTRAEVLYDAARFFRERSDNHASLLFSQAGMQIKKPDDMLFVNDFVYKSGLREEFSICAYYAGGKTRDRGAQVCNDLALEGSEQARNNLFWYLRPLPEHVPSFKPTWLKFDLDDGWAATNPSVINYQGRPVLVLRTVNYTITPEGVYAIRGKDGTCSPDWFVNPINTRNYLVHLSDALDILEVDELPLPENWPEPKFHPVRGLEDSRLFEWQGALWTISNVRELNAEGWCEQILVPLNARGLPWMRILPKKRYHEKNWQPWVKNDELRFVYRQGTLVDDDGNVVFESDSGFDARAISGGSQVIEANGVYLSLVHEARTIPGRPNRYYAHRFVRYAPDGAVTGMSMPFYFHDKQIEFAAGLAYFPERRQLMASYGVRDCEAWVARMGLDDVLAFIEKPR
jgi:glycosyltransferase involved in cell wall biosynthesis